MYVKERPNALGLYSPTSALGKPLSDPPVNTVQDGGQPASRLFSVSFAFCSPECFPKFGIPLRIWGMFPLNWRYVGLMPVKIRRLTCAEIVSW